VGADESNEKKFRRLFRAALNAEVEPALSALGFEIQGRGGYSLQWNSDLDFATNIRESKWNKFGAERFDVLFSIWMIETDSRRIRWIWMPTPDPDGGGWRYDSPDAMEGLGQRMIDSVLCSAVPLAFNVFGPPAHERLAQIARETAPEAARAIGDGYPMDWDS
jgi:hypothetical protein